MTSEINCAKIEAILVMFDKPLNHAHRNLQGSRHDNFKIINHPRYYRNVNIRNKFTNLATTRTLSNASTSESLSEVVADRVDKPEPRVDDLEDLADVEALAALLANKCK